MNDQERAAIQQALEALEAVDNDAHGTSFPATVSSAITDLLRAALAQQPEQERERVMTITTVPITVPRVLTDADLDAIRALLPEQPEPVQEPVAVFDERMGQPVLLPGAPMLKDEQPLYTTPPQRPPLPKHDQHCVDVPGYGLMAVRLVRAVERAHGIGEPVVRGE